MLNWLLYALYNYDRLKGSDCKHIYVMIRKTDTLLINFNQTGILLDSTYCTPLYGYTVRRTDLYIASDVGSNFTEVTESRLATAWIPNGEPQQRSLQLSIN